MQKHTKPLLDKEIWKEFGKSTSRIYIEIIQFSIMFIPKSKIFHKIIS